jgi:hypothetical protein
MTMVRGVFVVALSVAMLVAAACENTDPSPEEAQAIEEAVSGYLTALAKAYSTLDINVLEGHASTNEIAAVQKLLTELLQSTGDRIDAELIGFEIETMSVFRGINATVRLIEVWNITRYGAATGEEKGRFESTIQKTLLQLRLIDGRWIVVGRSNLEQETPVPVEATPPGESAS